MKGIYGIYNIKTNQWYVGQSSDIRARNATERSAMRCHGRLHYDGHNHKFESALQNYGFDSFRFFVLEECEATELNDKEMRWIQKLNAYENGFNLTIGGTSGSTGWKPTKEQRKNASVAQQKAITEGRNKNVFQSGPLNPMFGSKGYWYGKHMPEEIKSLLRDKAVARDIRGERNPHYGKKHSEEAKRKIGEASRKRVITEEWKRHISEAGASAKPVICIETGCKYRSCVEAAKKNGIKTPRNIGDACRGTIATCGGLHWAFIDRTEFYSN